MNNLSVKMNEIGQITSVTEALEASVIGGDHASREDGAIDDAYDLDVAISDAQMNGEPRHLIVTNELMNRLCKGKNLDSITKGDPGIRIYREGKKDSLDEIDRMSADEYIKHVGRQKQAARINK